MVFRELAGVRCFIPSFGGLLLPGGPAYHVFQTSLRPELKNFIRQGMHLLNQAFWIWTISPKRIRQVCMEAVISVSSSSARTSIF